MPRRSKPPSRTHHGGPTRAQLIEQNQQLRHENGQLWDGLRAETIEFPPSKQREFSITAAAMGLSLNQILVLLGLILGMQAGPGRSNVAPLDQGRGARRGTRPEGPRCPVPGVDPGRLPR